MLSFSKMLSEFRYSKLCVNSFQLKICNFYVDFISPLSLSGINYQNFYSTLADDNKSVLLHEISNLNCNDEKLDVDKIATLVEDIQKAKIMGKCLPQYIKIDDLRDLLDSETRGQKYSFLRHLFIKEIRKLKGIEKTARKKIEQENECDKKSVKTAHIEYGLGKNTMLLRTFKRNLYKYYSKRLANAALFGPKIVIDFGYDKFMTIKEKRACTSQIRLLYAFNMFEREPYDLYLCNANPESRCVQYLRREMPNIDDSFVTVTDKSYLDLFPKENLVYLSPHAPEDLATYDHKAIYIIGGFVDTVKREDISFSKAQEGGIKSYSLPLDKYLKWGSGTKSLAINQVYSIMKTLRDTGDWKEAFKHVPQRKQQKIDSKSLETEFCTKKLYAAKSN